MRASVIIPSYNDGHLLARCLDSLARQEFPSGEWEIVVALDGSVDGSRELLARGRGLPAAGPLDACVAPGAWRDLPLVVVDLPRNQGRSAARNAALAVSRGTHLCFLDADLRVGPGWLAALLAGCPTPEAVAVGEMVYEPAVPGSGAPSEADLLAAEPAAERWRRARLKRYQRYLETRGPWKHRQDPGMPARYFYTCNSCVPRPLLEAAGPFDERFRGWGGEDLDMGLKLGDAGARLRWRDGARALHAQERSFAAHCRNLARWGEAGLPLLVERHPALVSLLKLDHLPPGRAGGLAGRLLGAAHTLGMGRLLVALEAAGLPFPEKLYDLTVFLHYAGGYRRAAGSGRPEAVNVK